MLFKDISHLELRLTLCSGERNCYEILAEDISVDNSVKLFEFGPVLQEMSFKDIYYLDLCRPLYSA